jgi:hypothetical protein
MNARHSMSEGMKAVDVMVCMRNSGKLIALLKTASLKSNSIRDLVLPPHNMYSLRGSSAVGHYIKYMYLSTLIGGLIKPKTVLSLSKRIVDT